MQAYTWGNGSLQRERQKDKIECLISGGNDFWGGERKRREEVQNPVSAARKGAKEKIRPCSGLMGRKPVRE